MYTLSPAQRAWLAAQDTTPAFRRAFLARGPAEAMPMIGTGGEITYLAAVRGIAVTETAVADADAARETAEMARQNFALEALGAKTEGDPSSTRSRSGSTTSPATSTRP